MVAFAQFLIFLFFGFVTFLIFKFIALPAWRAMVRDAKEKEKQDQLLETIRLQNEQEESVHKVQADEELKEYLDGNTPNR